MRWMQYMAAGVCVWWMKYMGEGCNTWGRGGCNNPWHESQGLSQQQYLTTSNISQQPYPTISYNIQSHRANKFAIPNTNHLHTLNPFLGNIFS